MRKTICKRATITTESTGPYYDEVIRLTQGWFRAWSERHGLGGYTYTYTDTGERVKGTQVTEDSMDIIIIEPVGGPGCQIAKRLPGDGQGGRWFTFEDYVNFLAKAIREANDQETVMITWDEVEVTYV